MGLLSLIRRLGMGGHSPRQSATSTEPFTARPLSDDVQEKIRIFRQKHLLDE